MGLEHDLHQFFNRDLANPVLDPVLVLVSVLGFLVPMAFLGLALWSRGRRWEAATFWVAIVLAEIVSEGLKAVIERPRPSDVRMILWAGDSYSMPSGHALRASAAAVAVWRLGKWPRILGVAFAGLTALSRVYVGAHLPYDVLVGAALGIPVGFVSVALVRIFEHEARLPHEDRLPFFQFLAALLRTSDTMDRMFRLRLVGAGADHPTRWAVYWGLFRFFGPLAPVALFFVLYPILWPELYTGTLSCIAGYFFPFGLEWGVTVCITVFHLHWWQVVLVVTYLDVWLSLFMILNLDYLFAVPWLGPKLLKAQEKGLRFVRKRPWMLKVQFVGVAVLVFLPIAGTGIPSGILIGRFIGMPRFDVWAAAMMGTVVRVSLLALASKGILDLF